MYCRPSVCQSNQVKPIDFRSDDMLQTAPINLTASLRTGIQSCSIVSSRKQKLLTWPLVYRHIRIGQVCCTAYGASKWYTNRHQLPSWRANSICYVRICFRQAAHLWADKYKPRTSACRLKTRGDWKIDRTAYRVSDRLWLDLNHYSTIALH